jgi:NTE family protein
MSPRICLIFLTLPVLAVLPGCTHAVLNQPLTRYQPTGGFRYMPRSSTEGSGDLAVMLFFSGGGKRAAAFSYGVLKELDQTRAPIDGRDRRLLDEVEIISSVSGGSYTAAYYCLYHDRIFADFESRFLKRELNGPLLGSLVMPTHWPALASPYYGRSDLVADYFDRHLFDHATYGDLVKAGGRPFLMINATDMANGEQFSFSQIRFDLLSSDLTSYPLARAVAASSAVPVLLTPITLKNYAGILGSVQSDFLPPPITPTEASLPPREQEVRRLMRSYADSADRPYIHLVDGAFSDNLGLRSLMDASYLEGGLRNLMMHIHMVPPRRLVLVVVNAATRKGGKWDKRESIPGPWQTIDELGDDIGLRVNQRSLEVLQPMLEQWRRESIAHAAAGPPPDFYLVNVDFESLPDAKDRGFFENLATSYVLSNKTVDRLIAAGGSLLEKSPEFQRLLHDLNGPR